MSCPPAEQLHRKHAWSTTHACMDLLCNHLLTQGHPRMMQHFLFLYNVCVVASLLHVVISLLICLATCHSLSQIIKSVVMICSSIYFQQECGPTSQNNSPMSVVSIIPWLPVASMFLHVLTCFGESRQLLVRVITLVLHVAWFFGELIVTLQ